MSAIWDGTASGGTGVVNNPPINTNTNSSFDTTTSVQTLQLAGSNDCNESSVHNNDEKAVFHGVKSAFRMSREYDGQEYGAQDPQYEAAARMAAQTAIAYLSANDVAYDRDDSFDYLGDAVLDRDTSVVRRLINAFRRDSDGAAGDGMVTDAELSAGIAKAWTQIDKKRNHDDGARTALAIAEAYLNERLYT